MYRLALVILLIGSLLVSCGSGSDPGAPPGDDETSGEAESTLTPLDELVDQGQALSVRSLQLGHCWVDSSFDDADALTQLVGVIDCGQPHRAEVYSVTCLDTFDDELLIVPCGRESTPLDYPGEAVLDNIANEACLEGFEPFVGLEYPVSDIDFLTFKPGEAAWGGGDRTLVCSLVETDRSALVGTLLGAAR